MRIAVFTNTYLPTINGVANVVDAYRKALSELGHEVYLFAPGVVGNDAGHDKKAHIFRFPALEAPVDMSYQLAMPFSVQIMRILHDIEFDIVHTHHPLWVGVWGQWYAQWADVPLISTVHTEYQIYSDLIPLPGTMVEDFLRRRVAKYCNKCDLVTTPVESMRSKLRNVGVEAPIELLPNPADLAAFRITSGEEKRRELGVGDEEVLLGFVGRLSDEKNLPFVLRAAQIVMQRRPECRFLFVGGGHARSELENLSVALGIADRVIFAGETPHSQVPDYQAALDIFMTASMSETQPLAYTEAMAAGTPVVAVKAPGAQDMIVHGHNGLLTTFERGPQDLAQTVEQLLSDRELYSVLVQNGKKWVERYSVATCVERLVELYEEIIESHQDSSAD